MHGASARRMLVLSVRRPMAYMNIKPVDDRALFREGL
jgi:hypothetical protein